jgi:hypothetical protein
LWSFFDPATIFFEFFYAKMFLEECLFQLQVPPDSRAADLLNHLDNRYFRFLDHLPPLLKEVGLKRRSFTGTDEDTPFDGVSRLNPFMTCTPWLFWESFSQLEDEKILDIAEGGVFRSLAMIVMDHIVDQQVEDSKAMALFHQSLLGHGESVFRNVFDSMSYFWNHYERLDERYLKGISTELAAQKSPAHLDKDVFLTIVDGKVSPITIGLIALAIESDQEAIIDSIESSLKYAAAGTQLLDDIGDWESDLSVGHVTYYLVQLASSGDWEGRNLPSAGQIRSRIESEWADVENLKSVIDFLEQAVAAVKDVDCEGWIEYLNSYIVLAKKQMKRASMVHLERNLRPLVQGPKPN